MAVKRKMPSKAQAALLNRVADSPDEKVWAAVTGKWCVRLRPFGVSKVLDVTLSACKSFGWLTNEYPESRLTPTGREVLKDMENNNAK